MADLPSRDSKVAVSAAGSTYTDVGGVKEIGDWSISGSTIDVSDHDSGLFQEFLAGRGSLSFSLSGNYDEADAGQEILYTAAAARTKIYFRFRPKTASGSYEYIAQGIVTGFKSSGPDDAAVPFAVDVQLSGSPTRQAQ